MSKRHVQECPFTHWTAHNCHYAVHGDITMCDGGFRQSGGLFSSLEAMPKAWCNQMIARAIQVPVVFKELMKYDSEEE